MIFPGLETEDNMKLSITASFVSADLSQAAPGQPWPQRKQRTEMVAVRGEKTAASGGKLRKMIKYHFGLELELKPTNCEHQ